MLMAQKSVRAHGRASLACTEAWSPYVQQHYKDTTPLGKDGLFFSFSNMPGPFPPLPGRLQVPCLPPCPTSPSPCLLILRGWPVVRSSVKCPWSTGHSVGGHRPTLPLHSAHHSRSPLIRLALFSVILPLAYLSCSAPWPGTGHYT